MDANEPQDKRPDSTEEHSHKNLWLTELGLVAGCAVIFLAFLTGLINLYFPEGTTLVDDEYQNRFDDIAGTGDVVLGIKSEKPGAKHIVAGEIIQIQRRVQRRRARSLTWSNASVGDEFARNDAVQTFARSTALVQINDSSRLTIGENSRIVFDAEEASPFGDKQKSVLVMMNGELSGTLSGNENVLFGVNLPNSDVTLISEVPGNDIKFLITVNEDQSTTVNLHGGSATIVGRDGQRQTISANQSMTIDSSGTSMGVNKLPSTPPTTAPDNHTLVTYRNVPKEVVFDWEPIGKADRYRLVVARDAEFTDRIVDDDVVGTSFTHGALEAGDYYWHVRSRVGWSQSNNSIVRQLRIVQDLDAPKLQLDPPPEDIAAGNWRLSGQTDSDASVYVDGVLITHDNGRIDQPIELQPGANIITVRAMDSVGNLNYASLSINAK